MMLILCNHVYLFVFLRGYTEGFERESKRARSTRARTRANYRSSFLVQLWRLWKNIYWCWCFEEAFSHPWRETICLSLWRMWKGMSMFHAFLIPTPLRHFSFSICLEGLGTDAFVLWSLCSVFMLTYYRAFFYFFFYLYLLLPLSLCCWANNCLYVCRNFWIVQSWKDTFLFIQEKETLYALMKAVVRWWNIPYSIISIIKEFSYQP